MTQFLLKSVYCTTYSLVQTHRKQASLEAHICVPSPSSLILPMPRFSSAGLFEGTRTAHGESVGKRTVGSLFSAHPHP